MNSEKELTLFASQLPADPAALLKGLQNFGASVPSGMGGKPLLRLMKSGVFVYGPDNVDVQDGSLWALNPATLMHGVVCWEADDDSSTPNKMLDERMVPFNAPAPARDGLPDLGYPWAPQVSVELTCLNGEDEHTTVLYKGSSLGLRNAIKELIGAMMKQIMVDATHYVPVLKLGSDSYQHKKWGQTFYPVLTVLDWINTQGESASVAAAAPAQVAAPAAPVVETPAAATPTPSPEVPAATRRRRRAV